VDWGTQIAHIDGKDAIEFVEEFEASNLHRKARSLSLSHLISDLGVQPTPEAIGL
jgi:hypothetical protein